MILKFIGALFIISACGGMGYYIAAKQKREIRTLQELIRILDYMECELQYHLTPLPDLCRQTAQESKGIIGRIFSLLSNKLDDQLSNTVGECVLETLDNIKDIPDMTRENIVYLGESLGRFDLDGQLTGLEAARTKCRTDLTNLNKNKDARLRAYQTLGLCAGAAFVILFI